jgi:hypothetical protein
MRSPLATFPHGPASSPLRPSPAEQSRIPTGGLYAPSSYPGLDHPLEGPKTATSDRLASRAARVATVYGRKVAAAAKDPSERTRLATEARQATKAARVQRAIALRKEGKTAARTGEIMAAEEGRPFVPFDESTIRRWCRAGKSSG